MFCRKALQNFFNTIFLQLTWEKDRLKSPYTGIGHLVNMFEDPKDTPPPTRGETKAEKKRRRVCFIFFKLYMASCYHKTLIFNVKTYHGITQI